MIQHTLQPEELSQQLRNGTGAYMAQRRGIVSHSPDTAVNTTSQKKKGWKVYHAI